MENSAFLLLFFSNKNKINSSLHDFNALEPTVLPFSFLLTSFRLGMAHLTHLCPKGHLKYSKGTNLTGWPLHWGQSSSNSEHLRRPLAALRLGSLRKPNRSYGIFSPEKCTQILQKILERLTPHAYSRSPIKLPHYTNFKPSLYIPTQNFQAEEGTSVWMSEWMNEQMNKWRNEWMNCPLII